MALSQQSSTDSHETPPRAPTRRRRSWLALLLACLVILLAISGFLTQHVLFAGQGIQVTVTPFPSGKGQYIQYPLSAQQMSEIQHLSDHLKYMALASLYVDQMNLDDKLGQLIMLEFNETSYSDNLDYALNTLHVGGVIMYTLQMNTFSQTKNDIAHMQARANIPLIISTDQEGGIVNRLSSIYGPAMSETDMAATGDPNVAAQQGLLTSQRLAALGINEDLGPDVDIDEVGGYDMIDRTFGNNASDVIKYTTPYLKAMQGNGTIACIKHFPGLGGAVTDAHTSLPVVNRTKQQIYDEDLLPFKTFIQSPDAQLNPGMIMPTDVLMSAIDPNNSAELSHTFITDILRNQLHYNGVVMTDALYMDGMDRFTAAVQALQAGDDMILGPNDSAQTAQTIQTIKDALQSGQLSIDRVNEAVTRIIALKMQYKLMPTYAPIS